MNTQQKRKLETALAANEAVERSMIQLLAKNPENQLIQSLYRNVLLTGQNLKHVLHGEISFDVGKIETTRGGMKTPFDDLSDVIPR
jgi:hypothetical protein